MCNHIWKTVNDLRVCMRCGLTVRKYDGKIMFDKKLPDMMSRKGRNDK